MVDVCWSAVRPYYKNTSGLLRQTVAIAGDVTKKYRAAVQEACRNGGQVTVEELTSAAKSWGFAWDIDILTETNQMPTCSSGKTAHLSGWDNDLWQLASWYRS